MLARKRVEDRNMIMQRINYLKERIARDIRMNAMAGSVEAAWVLKHL